MADPQQPGATATQGEAAPYAVRIPAAARPLASEELLQGARSVEIIHNGLVYRLQATRLGKLILTK
jgi:hemin uptake protein HemP